MLEFTTTILVAYAVLHTYICHGQRLITHVFFTLVTESNIQSNRHEQHRFILQFRTSWKFEGSSLLVLENSFKTENSENYDRVPPTDSSVKRFPRSKQIKAFFGTIKLYALLNVYKVFPLHRRLSFTTEGRWNVDERNQQRVVRKDKQQKCLKGKGSVDDSRYVVL